MRSITCETSGLSIELPDPDTALETGDTGTCLVGCCVRRAPKGSNRGTCLGRWFVTGQTDEKITVKTINHIK